MTDSVAAKLHAESIVIDAVCPLVKYDPQYLDWYREGGVTVVAPTLTGGTQDAREALDALGMWHRLLRERPDLLLVRQARDIELAKTSGRLGIYLHCQGADALDDNLDLVDVYKALGVGMIQLTYNVKNRVGDGCEERTDAGLSSFGVKLIERLNKARIIVDCTHTGLRTSLEAVECSTAPVVLSHSNLAKLHPSARNVGPELVAAIVRSGGVIGAVGYPGMVSTSTTPTLDQFIAHIDALVELAGIDHVALGIDYYSGQAGVASDEEARRIYDTMVRNGAWGPATYPPPPHHYPTGIETPRTFQNLTRRLLERGYGASDVRKVLGENWLRVMRSVWG
jgi:membrane dipeptidase